MKSPKHTLVVVAFTTLVGCSSPSVPATMPETQALRLYTTSATLPLVADLTSAYDDPRVSFETRSGNFRMTLNSLLEGEAPYIVTNHLPPPETLNRPLWAAPIAQDSIAIIVNPQNDIDNLSLDQLRDIYQGRINHWQHLNGQNNDLVLFSREEGSGTRAEFESLVMGQRRTTLGARVVVSSQAMIEAIANTPGGIGYISLAYANDPRVKLLAIDGVPMTQLSVKQNRYPLRSTVFIVGFTEPQDDAYRAFIGWLQSPEGQTVAGRRYSPFIYPDS